MKKNIVIIVLAILLLGSGYYIWKQKDLEKVKEPETQDKTESEDNVSKDKEPTEEKPTEEETKEKDTEVEKPVSNKNDRIDRAEQELKKYGASNLPSKDTWISKQQGKNEAIVIVNQNSKNTHKVIFKTINGKEETIKVIVDNRMVYNKYKK